MVLFLSHLLSNSYMKQFLKYESVKDREGRVFKMMDQV